jgi:hypothetical protein
MSSHPFLLQPLHSSASYRPLHAHWLSACIQLKPSDLRSRSSQASIVPETQSPTPPMHGYVSHYTFYRFTGLSVRIVPFARPHMSQRPNIIYLGFLPIMDFLSLGKFCFPLREHAVYFSSLASISIHSSVCECCSRLQVRG